MLTRQIVAEANTIIANMAAVANARKEAEAILQANAHGANGAGLTIKLSAAIVAKVKAMRLAEIDALEASYRRRAAQIGLVL